MTGAMNSHTPPAERDRESQSVRNRRIIERRRYEGRSRHSSLWTTRRIADDENERGTDPNFGFELGAI